MSNPSRLFTKYKPKVLAGGGFMLDSNGQLIEADKLNTPTSNAPGQNTSTPKAAAGNPETPTTSNQPNYAGLAGTAAAVGTGIIDATSPTNEYGHQSTGSSIAKGALSGAALGTSILPGWGTAVGAVAGAAIGWVNGSNNSRADATMRQQMQRRQEAEQASYSRSVLASDPGKLTGYQNTDMFADGGVMGDPPAGGEWSPGSLQGSLSRRPTNLLDETNYILTHQGQRDKTLPRVQLNPNESQLMTDAYIWSQRPDMKGKAPQEVIGSYFGRPVRSGNAVDGLRASLNQVNHGAVSDYNLTPNIDVSGKPIPGIVMKKMGGNIRRKYAYGGTLDCSYADKNPVTELAEADGAKKLSLNNTLIKGPSHENGGVSIPALGAEVEGGETTKDSFVYSKRLGFAQQHLPLARAIGKIEIKPQTKERLNSLTRLKAREDELAVQQETLKKILGI